MKRWSGAALGGLLIAVAAGPGAFASADSASVDSSVVGAAAAEAPVAAPDGAEYVQEEPDNPHGEFRADCNICHVPEGWYPPRSSSEFDHSQFGYVLDGAHLDTPCLLCHMTLEFQPVTGTRCDECHQDVHAGELGSECEMCHTTRTFVERTDDIRTHRFTRFPLTGVHRTVDCASCHAPGAGSSMQFANTSADCFACHSDDYAAADPPHEPATYPQECQLCHTTFAWDHGALGDGAFDHGLTAFPLTGSHVAVDCQSCHGDGRYVGTPTDCFACHGVDYETASPQHTLPFFPTQCTSCHSTATWSSGFFDHDATAFPLTGAHRATDCASCHDAGRYTGTATDCFACHSDDYDATTAPDHALAGFGTDCAECHSTSTWLVGAPR